jgi:hypothetical protein
MAKEQKWKWLPKMIHIYFNVAYEPHRCSFTTMTIEKSNSMFEGLMSGSILEIAFAGANEKGGLYENLGETSGACRNVRVLASHVLGRCC